MTTKDMPPDWERFIALGMKHARNHFERCYSGPTNDRQRRAYLSGFATGVARFMAERYGSRAAYDLFTGLADEALERELPKGD